VTVSFISRVRSGLKAGTVIRNKATVDGLEVDPYTLQATGYGVAGDGSTLVRTGNGSPLARTSGGGYTSFWLAGGLALLGTLMLGTWQHGRRRGSRPEGGAS
jgi:hypothetical protein